MARSKTDGKRRFESSATFDGRRIVLHLCAGKVELDAGLTGPQAEEMARALSTAAEQLREHAGEMRASKGRRSKPFRVHCPEPELFELARARLLEAFGEARVSVDGQNILIAGATAHDLVRVFPRGFLSFFADNPNANAVMGFKTPLDISAEAR